MINRPIDLVSPNIKKYILDRMKYVTCNPTYFLSQSSMTESKLEEEVGRHSVNMELVNFSTSMSDSKKQKQIEKHRCMENLQSARNWARDNYTLPLTKDFVEIVGSLVEPSVNDQGFRIDKVRVSGALHSPPSPEKLEREMNIFIWENESITDALERAIHAHYGIARVHPFNDGNGRTARLVQDVILQSCNLPLAMIPLYERPEYIQRIASATDSYYEREAKFSGRTLDILGDLRELASQGNTLSPDQLKRAKYLSRLILSLRITPEQNAFYDFIALKVLNGLSTKLAKLYPSDEAMTRYYESVRHLKKPIKSHK